MATINKRRRLLITIVVIFLLSAFLFSFITNNNRMITEWLKEQWLEILIAFIFAIVAGVIIHYIYIRIKTKHKFEQNTILMKPRSVLAMLILPNNNEIKITEPEKIVGREDFVGAIPADDLQFIGRKHFKIIKMDNGLYIEDLDSANGTKLNGDEIKGAGRIELKDGDEILVADILKLRYVHFQG
ncbi:MAG: FHA domain-containing protein [Candidatus Methanoperedens sp.]|nr:FHA domain-containing protein [Candidatus Methanoperedens sp.]